MLTNARRFNFTRAAVALLLSAAIACGAEAAPPKTRPDDFTLWINSLSVT